MVCVSMRSRPLAKRTSSCRQSETPTGARRQRAYAGVRRSGLGTRCRRVQSPDGDVDEVPAVRGLHALLAQELRVVGGRNGVEVRAYQHPRDRTLDLERLGGAERLGERIEAFAIRELVPR